MNAGQVGRIATDFVRHFSYEWLFWQMQRCLNLCSILWLRAKPRFLRFAQKKPILDYEQNALFWDLPVNSSPQQQKTRRGKCLLREKGHVIGEITALEVAVITYIKRGEGWYLISLCLYDTSDNLRNVSDFF